MLARWSGWGAVPAVFDTGRTDLAEDRDELARLLSPDEMAAAARSTLNAHYTDAEFVRAIWTGLHDLGFTGGTVLEPGCGSGNFIGFAPPTAQMVGVELDPTTAVIAQALYPQAQILTESFAETRIPEQSFDAAVGNVPFGKLALTDPRHNPAGHSIHNHFIIKALHLVRPGGIVAVLTSRYTMDSRNPSARREMANLADLVGAVRLPTGAHQRAASTQVVTDLLVLRRREPGRAADGAGWERVMPWQVGDVHVEINEHFHAHPGRVLGEFALTHGAFRSDELAVISAVPPAQGLTDALSSIAQVASANDLRFTPRAAEVPDPRPAAWGSGQSERREGYVQATRTGGFTCFSGGEPRPHRVPVSQAPELRALLGLRDSAVALLEAEAASLEDMPAIDELRGQLRRRYRSYVDRHGPINRFSLRRTGRVDPDTGEQRLARVRPAQGGFRSDPFAPLVYALENFDATTQTATAADIFSRRVIAPRVPKLGADTAADALAICLDSFGEVRLTEIGRLLGVDADVARDELATLVFDDPGLDRLVPAAEYLSGNVRSKLRDATAAAERDPRYQVNVTALADVIPAELTPSDIHVRLGAPWIEASYVQQFLHETLSDPSLRVEHPGGQVWGVEGSRYGVTATSTWGTARRPAPDLAQALLEQSQITVYDKLDDGKRIMNLTETVAAQQKAQELDQRFAEWVWEDPTRAENLAKVYNDTFNAIVLRSYDDVELSLPGMALTFQPRPHQVAAVARIIHEPAVGLFHEVGAGKTAEMAMGAMELRRLRLVSKPAIVVPNHMLDQFSREFLQIYPRANILAAGGDDLTKERRRAFVARCATGDWDTVIMTRSAFERLPMSRAAQEAYLSQESERISTWIANAHGQGGRSLTVKRLQYHLLQAEERLKAKLSGQKDAGINFEMTGIDYLFIDEAHDYKNLRTLSNIPAVAIEGSQRASDLGMKLDHLRRSHGQRIGTLATATPIANSIAEAYTMQRYLRPDLVEAAGLGEFDSWAATFGELVTQIELSPDGGRFRMQTRFSRFRNVPELLRMWHVSADVKTAEDLNLPTPLLAVRPDGQRAPETVVIDPSPELLDFVQELAYRAERVRSRAVTPNEDNMLKIATEGRLAALDLRLVGRTTEHPGKLDAVAERVARIWHRFRDTTYPTPGGGNSSLTGALQLVFSDLGTPREDGWDVYHELREQLYARGLPAGSVRFVHEARNDIAKGALFAACREGRVAVLIGSTQKMGVGTNVQARAAALHHVDCPWRPADLAQRDGRVLRQGNLNDEVEILRYVTEGSFDAYSWQTVQRKARFIAQVMRGRLDMREIEDIGDAALSYDEVKALATGDPRVLEKAQADADLTRLERLERAHYRGQESLAHAARSAEANAASNVREAQAVAEAIARRIDTRGEAFTMQLGERHYSSRPDAGQALQTLLQPELDHLDPTSRPRPTRVIGKLGGFALTTHSWPAGDKVYVEFTLDGAPRGSTSLTRDELRDANPTGLITRLENKLTGLERLAEQLEADTQRQLIEAQRAREQHGKPFLQADQLQRTRDRVAELQQELEQLAQPAAQPTAAADGPPSKASPGISERTQADLAESGRGGPPPNPHVVGEARHAARAAARVLRPDPAISPAAHAGYRDRSTKPARSPHLPVPQQPVQPRQRP